MFFGQLHAAARIRILVAGAKLQEQGGGARILAFQLPFGDTGVIAAQLVEFAGERRIVAGVSEEHGAHAAIGRRDPDDRHLVVDRSGAIDPDPDTVRGGFAAIDGEAHLAEAEGELGGREIGHRHAGHRHQIAGETCGVLAQFLFLVRRQVPHAGQVRPHDRTGVGMARVQQQARPLDAELVPHTRGDLIGDFGRQADQVRGDDDDAASRTRVDGQGARVQPLPHPVRRMVAAGVARHPDGTLRRDIHPRGAGAAGPPPIPGARSRATA